LHIPGKSFAYSWHVPRTTDLCEKESWSKYSFLTLAALVAVVDAAVVRRRREEALGAAAT
jgi:hypothetical protein